MSQACPGCPGTGGAMVPLSDISHFHDVAQQSHYPFQKPFHLLKQKLRPLSNNPSFPPLPSALQALTSVCIGLTQIFKRVTDDVSSLSVCSVLLSFFGLFLTLVISIVMPPSSLNSLLFSGYFFFSLHFVFEFSG